MRHECHVSPIAVLSATELSFRAYSIDAAAIGERSCTVDSSNVDLTGNTVEPSELVPSGKVTTTEP
jgi:hypothetical protein